MSLALSGDAPAGRDVHRLDGERGAGEADLRLDQFRVRFDATSVLPRHHWSPTQEDSMMDEKAKGVKNQVVGATKEAAGKLRDAVADITGDTSEQIKGKAQVVEGKVQSAVGRAQEKLGAKKDQNRDVNKDLNKNRP
jgi:uncharacterized protein YjbJ (UPF0337 family)